MNKSLNSAVVFSRHKSERIFIKLYVPVTLFAIALSCLAEAFGYYSSIPKTTASFPIKTISSVLPLLLACNLIFYWQYSKFAFEIIFFEKMKKIEVRPFLKKTVKTYQLSQLEEIYINWYTNLRFADGYVIKYRASDEFVEFVARNKINVSWGKFGKYFFKDIYQKYEMRKA